MQRHSALAVMPCRPGMGPSCVIHHRNIGVQCCSQHRFHLCMQDQCLPVLLQCLVVRNRNAASHGLYHTMEKVSHEGLLLDSILT